VQQKIEHLRFDVNDVRAGPELSPARIDREFIEMKQQDARPYRF
jgi:hypothetical protein